MKLRTAMTVVAVLLLALAAPARQQASAPSTSLKAFVRTYLSPGRVPPDRTTRITVSSVKAHDGQGEEELVYVTGQRWCGSGGCTMLILEPLGSSFKVLGRVTVVQLPIRLLASSSYGRPDIGVRVQPGYEAVLSFDGTSYPRNPTIPPARRSETSVGREVITTSSASEPLYE